MTDLSENRLIELIEAYGADSARWPVAERAAGQALLARSPAARAAAQAAQSLDALLAQAPVSTASPALLERVLSAAMPVPAPAVLPARPGAWTRAAAFLAAAFRPPAAWSVSGILRPAALVLTAGVVGLGLGYGLGGRTQTDHWDQYAWLDNVSGGMQDLGDWTAEAPQ